MQQQSLSIKYQTHSRVSNRRQLGEGEECGMSGMKMATEETTEYILYLIQNLLGTADHTQKSCVAGSQKSVDDHESREQNSKKTSNNN
jgi:hypothetical protein